MKIGEVAKRTGLKVETVRFYEAEGLITPPLRSGGNYRMYDDKQVKRLLFVRRARDLGFTLEQVRELLTLADEPRRSCAEVDAIAIAHLREVDRKLADLQAFKAEILSRLECCTRTSVADCQIIEALSTDEQF
ncbi:MerR family transcriptional regulator [Sphingomonas beigongshangi]|uniref:MerR family transcriptional regulator n=1 Tax=Sphingomonas beigongshangi TaxID=2782540 RepID=UPI001AEE2941|nr:helix-turn-helix domain-containing protein [Sphingomonas beigongshangi]